MRMIKRFKLKIIKYLFLVLCICYLSCILDIDKSTNDSDNEEITSSVAVNENEYKVGFSGVIDSLLMKTDSVAVVDFFINNEPIFEVVSNDKYHIRHTNDYNHWTDNDDRHTYTINFLDSSQTFENVPYSFEGTYLCIKHSDNKIYRIDRTDKNNKWYDEDDEFDSGWNEPYDDEEAVNDGFPGIFQGYVNLIRYLSEIEMPELLDGAYDVKNIYMLRYVGDDFPSSAWSTFDIEKAESQEGERYSRIDTQIYFNSNKKLSKIVSKEYKIGESEVYRTVVMKFAYKNAITLKDYNINESSLPKLPE